MKVWLCLATCLLLSACGSSGAPANGTGTTETGGENRPGPVILPRDCFWAARSDANALNILYPDRYATYWVAALTIPPGGEVRQKAAIRTRAACPSTSTTRGWNRWTRWPT